jgi:hypothetical protein
MQRTRPRSAAEERPADHAAPRFTPESDFEVVRLRNYDHWQGHSIRVEVVPVDGEVALSERHYLAPDHTAQVTGRLDPGPHEVRVCVDGVERARAVCRLDETPSGTAIVELGNGIVSLTEDASDATSTV